MFRERYLGLKGDIQGVTKHEHLDWTKRSSLLSNNCLKHVNKKVS